MHLLRAQCDAILVGTGTVLSDDPLLTCRLPGMEARSPVRVVLDRALRMPGTSRLVHSARSTPLWVVTSNLAEAPAVAMLGAAGAQVDPRRVDADRIGPVGGAARSGRTWHHPASGRGRSTRGVLVVAADLVDEFWLLRGRDTIGTDGVAALDALPLTAITQSSAFRVRASESLGTDTLTVYERS